MGKYLQWKEKIRVEYISDVLILLYVEREKGGVIDRNAINDTAYEIITLIDGTRTINEILASLCSKYKETKEEISQKLFPFLKTIQDDYNIHVLESDVCEERPVITEFSNMYPRVASIEITNKCNLCCLHCYGSFGCSNQQVMSLENIKKLLYDLNEVHAFAIELTGGECLFHPDFKEILLYALSLDFVQISILTNGILLNDEIISIIVNNKDRVFVQIDLHSMSDNYLYWFTGVKNSLETIKNNIQKLASQKVFLRVATIVTKRNINEVNDIAAWVYSQGIKAYSISPVIKLGRAEHSDTDILLDDEYYVDLLYKLINDINYKYDNIIVDVEPSDEQSLNCGCLSSHITVNTSGNIKVCTMDNTEYVNTNYGNVFEKSIKEIYDKNQDKIIRFSNILAPKIDSDSCRDCEHKYFCSTCVLRAFVKIKEIGNDCKWFNTLDDKLKQDLFS